MRLLLDTHIALWAIASDRRLPKRARELISSPANDIVISAASIWEIAVKFALGRGRTNDMPISGTDALNYFQAAGYELLPVAPSHAAALDALPLRHQDPFDRLLIAQALCEPLRFLTCDTQLAAYSDTIILV